MKRACYGKCKVNVSYVYFFNLSLYNLRISVCFSMESPTYGTPEINIRWCEKSFLMVVSYDYKFVF